MCCDEFWKNHTQTELYWPCDSSYWSPEILEFSTSSWFLYIQCLQGLLLTTLPCNMRMFTESNFGRGCREYYSSVDGDIHLTRWKSVFDEPKASKINSESNQVNFPNRALWEYNMLVSWMKQHLKKIRSQKFPRLTQSARCPMQFGFVYREFRLMEFTKTTSLQLKQKAI